MNKHMLRAAAAVAGVSAVIAMGALAVSSGASQANAVVPEHFGGPVYTSIYNPAVTLGVPTLSSSSVDAPAPMNTTG
jgi:hypothetical protein